MAALPDKNPSAKKGLSGRLVASIATSMALKLRGVLARITHSKPTAWDCASCSFRTWSCSKSHETKQLAILARQRPQCPAVKTYSDVRTAPAPPPPSLLDVPPQPQHQRPRPSIPTSLGTLGETLKRDPCSLQRVL